MNDLQWQRSVWRFGTHTKPSFDRFRFFVLFCQQLRWFFFWLSKVEQQSVCSIQTLENGKIKCQIGDCKSCCMHKANKQTFICFISFRFTLNDITHVIRRHAMHKGIERRKQHIVRGEMRSSTQHTHTLTRIPTMCARLCVCVCVFERDICFLSQFFITF